MPIFETDDRTKLYYEVCGKGDAVIFLHGLTATHRHFKYQIKSFRQHFKTVVLDFRGHGASETSKSSLNIKTLARDLKALTEYLSLPTFSLVGWSMGTHVIFDFIEQFGCESINRICIIDMTPRLLMADETSGTGVWTHGLRGSNGEFGSFDFKDAAMTLHLIAEADMASFSKKLVERLYDRSLYKKGRFDDNADFKGKKDFNWLLCEAAQNKIHVILSYWASMVGLDYRLTLGKISVPVLITYGAGSQYYSKENSEYMYANIQSASLIEFKGCGHALHIQDPKAFNDALGQFLTK